MTEIILARHGETGWNVGEIYRGTVDVTLDELGLKQAELLGRHLSDWEIDAIYSSPLRRALRTAGAIDQYHKIGVKVTDDLIDINYGKWQGLPEQEVKNLYPILHDEWRNSPHLVKFPDGESLADVRKRATSMITELISQYERSVVLVSHRVVNKVLICSLLGLDNSHFWNIKQDMAGITIFNYRDSRFILTRHNDTSHLKSIQEYTLSDF